MSDPNVQSAYVTSLENATSVPGRRQTAVVASRRWKDRARKTVESYWMLDVNQLSEMGCLRPGWSGTCQWTDGNEVSSISLRCEAGRLHLSYRGRIGEGKWEDMAETIPIVHLRCRFGGSRAYFICPGPRLRTAHNQAAPLAPLFSMPTLQSARLRKPVRTTMEAGTQAS
jgi:hypothetical protein